jgi:hypothetical protein
MKKQSNELSTYLEYVRIFRNIYKNNIKLDCLQYQNKT